MTGPEFTNGQRVFVYATVDIPEPCAEGEIRLTLADAPEWPVWIKPEHIHPAAPVTHHGDDEPVPDRVLAALAEVQVDDEVEIVACYTDYPGHIGQRGRLVCIDSDGDFEVRLPGPTIDNCTATEVRLITPDPTPEPVVPVVGGRYMFATNQAVECVRVDGDDFRFRWADGSEWVGRATGIARYTWTPVEPEYAEGTVVQAPSGQRYARRNGRWCYASEFWDEGIAYEQIPHPLTVIGRITREPVDGAP